MSRARSASSPVSAPALAVATGLALVALVPFTHGMARFHANVVVWFLFLLSVALGALFFVALGHLTGARSTVPTRRVFERVASLLLPALPLAALALLAVPTLYPWARPGAILSPIAAGKIPWLNMPFFSARLALCCLAWLFFYRVFVGRSFAQDLDRDPAHTVAARRHAPAFMIVFAVTVTVVAYDWLSSLEPEWYSDILGVYLFAGLFLAGLTAAVLRILALRRAGRLAELREPHLADLGGYLFAFTVFWSYIAFAQYLLMWYANLPEEVVWYEHRLHGGFAFAAPALALLHFAVPFLMLIPRAAKGDPRRLTVVCALLLACHWLDLWWHIFPALGHGRFLSWPELSFALLFGGVALAWLARADRRGEDMPAGDPFLAEGLAMHR